MSSLNAQDRHERRLLGTETPAHAVCYYALGNRKSRLKTARVDDLKSTQIIDTEKIISFLVPLFEMKASNKISSIM